MAQLNLGCFSTELGKESLEIGSPALLWLVDTHTIESLKSSFLGNS